MKTLDSFRDLALGDRVVLTDRRRTIEGTLKAILDFDFARGGGVFAHVTDDYGRLHATVVGLVQKIERRP